MVAEDEEDGATVLLVTPVCSEFEAEEQLTGAAIEAGLKVVGVAVSSLPWNRNHKSR